MDEEEDKVATSSSTVGARLKAARIKQKMGLEDIAAQTRIPLRHLESVEESAWDRLPAPTYTIGFAKAYAGAVGMDRAEIGEQLARGDRRPQLQSDLDRQFRAGRSGADHAQMAGDRGDRRGSAARSPAELAQRTLARVRRAGGQQSPRRSPPRPPLRPPPSRLRRARWCCRRIEQVWLQVNDKGGTSISRACSTRARPSPSRRARPRRCSRPPSPRRCELTVGAAIAPTVGPAGRMISDVSLLPADLLRGGPAPAPPAAAGPVAAASSAASRLPPPRPRTARRSPPPPPPPAPVPEPQPEVNGADG